MWVGVDMERSEDKHGVIYFLLTCGFQRLNSGHLAWWHMTLFRAIPLGPRHFIAKSDAGQKELNPEWTL